MFVFGHAHRIAKAVNDRESEAVLRRLEDFLNTETPEMVRWLYSIFRDQQDAVTYRELREAVEDGYEQEILQWQDDYARMVNEKLKPVLLEAMKAGAAEWERKLGGKLLDDTDRDVQKWIEDHCAAFVTNMADEARGAIKTILWRGQQEEWTPAVIAQHIRPVIGQTRPDAIAIDNYHRNMLKTLREAHPRTADEKLVARAEDMTLKYAALKHRQRADMIANTELAYAYNRGAHESVRAAMKRGLMGPVEKVWLTAGTERVCQHCAGLNGKVVGFDDNFDIPGRILFAGMHETPPAHPRCRCVVQYREITAPVVIPQKLPVSQPTTDIGAGKTPVVTIESIKAKIAAKPLSRMTYEEVSDIGEEIDDLYSVSKHLGDKERLKEIFSNFREMGGTLEDDQFGRYSNKENIKQIRQAFSYYPKDWADYLRSNKKKIFSPKSSRGFFYRYCALNGDGIHIASADRLKEDPFNFITICLDGVRRTTPFHEIGHMVEFLNPNALHISKDFVKKRTEGEPEIGLVSLFPGYKYNRQEKVKKDDFISPYIGKVYDNATEVLSIGLEQIFEPQEQIKYIHIDENGRKRSVTSIITDDEEYLHLIIGLIVLA